MAILNLPAWSFEPNWSDDLLETLEWLTDVLRSPSGAEQRRALRSFPRRSFEYAVVADGAERAYLDNLLMTHGARDWYLPLWHDVHLLSADVATGATAILCPTMTESEMRPGDVAFIGGDSALVFELVEVSAITSGGITLTAPLANAWPTGTRIYPARIARLTEQPQLSRHSDKAITAQVRLRVVESNVRHETADRPAALPYSYRGFPVLLSEPDETERLEYGYERMLEEIDNQVGIPTRYDSTGLAFPNQRFRWVIQGRQQHMVFRDLLYTLRGKALPLWLPTFFSDFELAAPAVAGSSALTVTNVGFTALGGPREGRRDIVIDLTNGTRLYYRLVASAIATGGREVLGLDDVLPDNLDPTDVVRISFMALARLDQDNIEVAHRTDTAGVSTVVATFRSTPDLRQVAPGF